MIIRKQFTFEGAHIVRNCSSKRCSHSIHGHSYIVEVFISAKGLDCGGMLLDFGLLKGTIKDFIDSFDHAFSVWNKDEKIVQIAQEYSDRYIVMPVSPSAENYALMFLMVIDRFMEATQFNNGENKPYVRSVRVHETATGYAEAYREDLAWIDYSLEDVVFSHGIIEEWHDQEMYEKLKRFQRDGQYEAAFFNAKPRHQVKFKIGEKR
jgi:6-pyruvoyltetrahydropterin/6-carboxytetrahydropterin synthase